MQAFDAQQSHWFLSDPELPENVANLIESLSSATALWMTAPAEISLQPAATEKQDVIFYNGDHLGSTNVMTDRDGNLLEEIAYYPYGEVRNIHMPGLISRNSYGFTQKEQDAESDLHYFEARYMAGSSGRFLSTDPKYANPSMLSQQDFSSYLSNPLKNNLYSYVLNNPIRYNDPTGLDENMSVPAQLSEKTGDVSTLDSLFAAGLESVGGANTSFPRTELSTGLKDVSSGAKLTNAGRFLGNFGNVAQSASLVCEAVDFAQDPTTDKGVHLGGTAVITVGGFISGPGAAIASGTRYVYENSPSIHNAANSLGDLAVDNGATKVQGGMVASGASVVFSVGKLGAMMGGGQTAGAGVDVLLEHPREVLDFLGLPGGN
jgi:RHS repeat-associated protein